MNATNPTLPRLFSGPTGCTGLSSEIALPKGMLHSWTGNRVGLLIEAREGAAWLTQMGDGEDIVLSRGQTFRVNRPGRVVVQSLTAMARLAVCQGN
jgi:hypothetical protein